MIRVNGAFFLLNPLKSVKYFLILILYSYY